MKPFLLDKYTATIKQQLQKDLSLANSMEVPKITKIVLNIGFKELVGDTKEIARVVQKLSGIAQQAPVIRKAKKSIASFKIREGMNIGASVTLRNEKMYYFLQKLIDLALPRVRDFQGVGTGFDGMGNYNLGIKDWIIFPEVEDTGLEKTYGFNITVCTSAKNDVHAYELLKAFGMPFAKNSKVTA